MATAHPTSSELFREQAAADYLGVAPQTLAAWRCRRNRGPAFVRSGRFVRYRRVDLDRWLDQQVVHTTDSNPEA